MRAAADRLGVWIAAGSILIGVGIAQLGVAPRAASCVESGDTRVCETIGVIVLNVSGIACLLAGLAILGVAVAREARHKISV
jgi:hypothetical protein